MGILFDCLTLNLNLSNSSFKPRIVIKYRLLYDDNSLGVVVGEHAA